MRRNLLLFCVVFGAVHKNVLCFFDNYFCCLSISKIDFLQNYFCFKLCLFIDRLNLSTQLDTSNEIPETAEPPNNSTQVSLISYRFIQTYLFLFCNWVCMVN